MTHRLTALLAIIFFQRTTTFCKHAQLEINGYQNEVLIESIYRNITESSMERCLEHCVSDCLCQSFQICGSTCQLSSSARTLETTALLQRFDCVRFEITNAESLLRNDECPSYSNALNCCLTSNPCLNNGICTLGPLPSNSDRYTCKCVDGFSGPRCRVKPKSCRAFLNDGEQQQGLFTIFNYNDHPYSVFCTFDSKTTAWTLVQSYRFSERGAFLNPIYKNTPRNQGRPSSTNYRLSWPRMNEIKNDFNKKWRMTCNYDKDGLVYTDYVRANHIDAPILSKDADSQYAECKYVEFIDIRGTNCSDCQVFMAQKNQQIIHIDSYYSKVSCQFPISGSLSCGIAGEDNFGLYLCRNNEHRCSSSSDATTQLWFGGE